MRDGKFFLRSHAGAWEREESRYRIYDNAYPHFLTCTVVGWLPVFTRPEVVLNGQELDSGEMGTADPQKLGACYIVSILTFGEVGGGQESRPLGPPPLYPRLILVMPLLVNF